MNIQPPFPAYCGSESYAFVCHAHADCEQIYPEISWLHENDCNIWYDEGIQPANQWRNEIAEKILSSGVFVVYLSPNSIDSEECMKELSFALDHNIPVLAVYLRQFSLPPGIRLSLNNRQAIERYRYSEDAYRVKLKNGVAKLLDVGYSRIGEQQFRPFSFADDSQAEIEGRYRIIKQISADQRLELVRAYDRISEKTVTIKRDLPDFPGESELAEEFRLLAPLHHPNLVLVLDFGIQEDGREFLVFDLQENAQSLDMFARNQPVSFQLDLLSQGIRALHYLHRKSIPCKNIAAQSVIVDHGSLKLFNFLACSNNDQAVVAGKLHAESGNPFEAALFDYGALAYRALVAGAAPPAPGISAEKLSGKGLDSRLARILAGLLEADPGKRFQSAIAGFAQGDGDGGIVLETALTRESALQTARFVGRERELDLLHRALQSASRGRGRVTLISGESGVGKSRLLGEFINTAKLSGFRVMQGSAVEGDSGSYRIWDEVAKFYGVLFSGSGAQAAATKSKTDAADPAHSIDERSFLRLESAMGRSGKKSLIVLEDLHWAGTESIRLLKWLAKPVSSMPIIILCTTRPEEGFDPAEIGDGLELVKLPRLSVNEIKQLASNILGWDPDARLRDCLSWETVGNSVVVVDTLRALDEEAGALNRVESDNLPEKVLSGGMQRVLHRRIERVGAADLEIIKTAAVIGRAVDHEVLTILHPQLDVEAWAQRCASEAILEYREQHYRFSHEKLREFVLRQLDRKEMVAIHKKVALALEGGTRSKSLLANALAYHWSQVGERDKEAEYSLLAGKQTLAGGALREAVAYFKRLGVLLQQGANLHGNDIDAAALVDTNLSDVYYRMGNLAKCTEHSTRAIKSLGAYFPGNRFSMGAVTLVELIRAIRNRQVGLEKSSRAVEISRAQLRLTDIYFYSLQQLPAVWSTLRAVNEARKRGEPREQAQAYALAGALANAAKLKTLARGYSLHALRSARSANDDRYKSFVNSRLAVQSYTDCQWRKARARILLANKLAEKCGDLRLLEETLSTNALVDFFTGNFKAAITSFSAARDYARRAGDRQIECWGAQGEAGCYIRLGRSEEARELGLSTLDIVNDPFMKTEAIATHAILACVNQRAGEMATAFSHIDEALQRLENTPPMAYWTQGPLEMLLETIFASLDPANSDAQLLKRKNSAMKSLASFARNQTIGAPMGCLWKGVDFAAQGKVHAARRVLQSGVALAQSLDMPYEKAKLQLELWRTDAADVGNLNDAEAAFRRMGCLYELDKITEAVAHP
ncbi:MAG: AAA family ATPase [Gammaproteobacteria bacterium]